MRNRIANSITGRSMVSIGLDTRDKTKAAVRDAILMDAGINIESPAHGANEIRGEGLSSYARKTLAAQGIEFKGDEYQIVSRALVAQDFTSIMSDVFTTLLIQGFNASNETWQDWCGVGKLSDFRTANLAQFEVDDLKSVNPDGGEFLYGKLADNGESATLATFGKIFLMTKRMVVNNEANLIANVARKFGEAGARKIGDKVFSLLINNGVMADGVPTFHSDHANVGTGGAISDTTIGEAVGLMKKQTFLGSTTPANIPAKYLITPAALEISAANALRSIHGDTGKIQLIGDARLDSDSAAKWYMAGPQGSSVVVYGLNGRLEPTVESQNAWASDGIEYKVRLDTVAAVVDHRGMVYNAGA